MTPYEMVCAWSSLGALKYLDRRKAYEVLYGIPILALNAEMN